MRVRGRLFGRSWLAAAVVASALWPSTALASNDPFFPQQWGLAGATASINAPQAWCAGTGGVLAADVDTGADFAHPDLSGRLLSGARFTNGDGSKSSGSLDDHVGHGTMTVGLMVATKDNGIGIAGIAPKSQALVVKVFDDSGSGDTSDAAAGIEWAADNGARVINVSLGSDLQGLRVAPDFIDTSIANAADYAVKHGAMVALAAGNSSLPASEYQQVSSETLVVGALRRDGQAASYSTNTLGVNIWAPGGEGSDGVLSTYFDTKDAANPHKYAFGDGTSFAAPHVAGTLALLMSRGLSPGDARQRILDTAANRNGLPELSAAAALGTSAGCSGTTPSGNGSGGSPAGGASGGGNGGSRQPGSGHGGGGAGAGVGGTTPPPASSPGPSESALALGGEPSPGHRNPGISSPQPPRSGSPLAPIIGGAALLAAAGGGFWFFLSKRRRGAAGVDKST